MSDVSKAGPAHTETVHEVQGHFPTDAAMQDALSRLTLAGYDRAAFSLPDEQSPATPNEGADNPIDAIDKAQLRTMGTGMAGYAGAAAVAAATVATGGAAGLAVAAAAAVGAGTALTAHVAAQAADRANVAERDEKGREGKLILAVRTETPEKIAEVIKLMHEAGATDAQPVARGTDMLTSGVSAASWTGA